MSSSQNLPVQYRINQTIKTAARKTFLIIVIGVRKARIIKPQEVDDRECINTNCLGYFDVVASLKGVKKEATNVEDGAARRDAGLRAVLISDDEPQIGLKMRRGVPLGPLSDITDMLAARGSRLLQMPLRSSLRDCFSHACSGSGQRGRSWGSTTITREAPASHLVNVRRGWRSEHELVPDDKGRPPGAARAPGAGEMRGRTTRVTPPPTRSSDLVPQTPDATRS